MLHKPRTWVEVSRSALRYNLHQVQRAVGKDVGILPIVKANAYGHGVAEVLQSLREERIKGLGVAHGEEALQLRGLGYRGTVIVLSSWQPEELPTLLKHKIELVSWDLRSLQVLKAAAVRLRRKARVHLKIDTGTSRIGYLKKDFSALQKALNAPQKQVNIVGVFSHLANSEEALTGRTDNQIHRFTTLRNILKVGKVEEHLACTAAALRYPSSRHSFVRLGIGLYGLWPSSEIKLWAKQNLKDLQFRPALSWFTKLEQIKRLPAKSRIGYGSTVILRKPTTVGIVPVGYSDGFDRLASGKALVSIRNKPVRVLGRISMNLLAIDLTGIQNPRVGQTIGLIDKLVPAEKLAAVIQTINYEVVAGINPNIQRFLVA